MFEKSLYDLIRGLRNHKANEKEYIQKSLKECLTEIRNQDMDVKATALLKLIYLEMVGYDMSWASFHVLEVMSSAKYHQKRVGYLGAAQSFRPDTEVLMLATNLLKKDLASSAPTVISLPIATLPHVITPSLAQSTLADLLPRLSHSHANIRKKTLVTLYRLALVFPEALRAAWPKVKERLMDADEDPSVTAAIVNVICELGWRRPQDFLPLAPRLFELLVDGNNNWMAIKLIKLFATLTPLEPRLVKKLLPSLTKIMTKTTAMSLLYECINGIIQGGILGNSEDALGSEEIATLCVNKLRSMILINNDPNLKYVALLGFNRIIITHPYLVAQQEDVILECVDNPDITIRIQALDLVQGMVTAENLVSIVSRLMMQLKNAYPSEESKKWVINLYEPHNELDDEFQPAIAIPAETDNGSLYLPDGYLIDVIKRILFICSKSNYANVADFDWYIYVLTQLVRLTPVPRAHDTKPGLDAMSRQATDVSEKIGDELRNVAVKVRAMRALAVRAAESVLIHLSADGHVGRKITSGALKPIVWTLGEYASLLSSPEDTLSQLLQVTPRADRHEVCATLLFAVMKVFASVAGDSLHPWTAERKSSMSLLIARIINAAKPLVLHPNLEVQERAVEFIELLRLTAEAASGQAASVGTDRNPPPLLLTQAVPSLFNGWELNSVAPDAQRNVPKPEDLNLNEKIHPNLDQFLARADAIISESEDMDEFEAYYNQRPIQSGMSSSAPAANTLLEPIEQAVDSQQKLPSEDSSFEASNIAQRKMERLERNRDDPFYIPYNDVQRASTPIHNILQSNNGPYLDIDAIPIMQLEIDSVKFEPFWPPKPRRESRRNVIIEADETLEIRESRPGRSYERANSSESLSKIKNKKFKQSLLQVDSSTIGSFDLEGGRPSRGVDYEQQQREEVEMEQALKDVERLRLEMQRANERIQVAQGVDAAGTFIISKSKKSVDQIGHNDGAASQEKIKKSKTKINNKKKKKSKEGEKNRETEATEENKKGHDNQEENTQRVSPGQ